MKCRVKTIKNQIEKYKHATNVLKIVPRNVKRSFHFKYQIGIDFFAVHGKNIF